MTKTWWEEERNIEQRLLVWPRSRAHSVTVTATWIHCMQRNIVRFVHIGDWIQKPTWISWYFWECEKPQRRRPFTRTTIQMIFLRSITSDECWRQNNAIASISQKKSFRWSSINSNLRLKSPMNNFSIEFIPSNWRRAKRLTASTLDTFCSRHN